MEEYESSEHEYDYDQFMDIKKTIGMSFSTLQDYLFCTSLLIFIQALPHSAVDDNVEKFLELIKTAKSVNMKDPIDCDNTYEIIG
jgi:hypothetical protein